MKIDVIKTNWFKGVWFQWREFYFNGGKTYRAYRLGPIIIRVYDENTKT